MPFSLVPFVRSTDGHRRVGEARGGGRIAGKQAEWGVHQQHTKTTTRRKKVPFLLTFGMAN